MRRYFWAAKVKATVEEAARAKPRVVPITAKQQATPVNPQRQRKVGEIKREGLKGMAGELVVRVVKLAPEPDRIRAPAGTGSREGKHRGQECKARPHARRDGTKAKRKAGKVQTHRLDSRAKVVVDPSRALAKWRGRIAHAGQEEVMRAVRQAEGRAG